MTVTVKPVDFVAIKSGDELTIEAADLAAEMLVRTYVPEYEPDVMTWQEALELAELRDEQAAYELEQGALDLEASIMATLDAEDEEDDLAAEVVNMLLETAAMIDKKRSKEIELP